MIAQSSEKKKVCNVAQSEAPCCSSSTSNVVVSSRADTSSKLHVQKKEVGKTVFKHICLKCNKGYDSYRRYLNHQEVHKMSPEESSNEHGSILLVESALNNAARVYDITPSSNTNDLNQFMTNMYEVIRDTITHLTESAQVKARFVAQVRYIRADGSDDSFLAHFTSFASEYIFDFDTWFNSHLNRLLSHLETFAKKGSNWIIDKVVNVEINTILIPNLVGSCCSFVLPTKLRNTHSIINVRNSDDKCFLYAILSILHYENARRNGFNVSFLRQYLKEFNLSDIQLPMKI